MGKPRKRSKIPRMKKWTFVLITWLDAVTREGSQHSDGEFNGVVRHSVGHFISRTKETITIAMEDDRDTNDGVSDCDNVTTIPIGMVKQAQILIIKPEKDSAKLEEEAATT